MSGKTMFDKNMKQIIDAATKAGQTLPVPAQGSLFWATGEARTIGTSGEFEANIDCANGVKLRFEGKHNGIGLIGWFVGTGPGVLTVDPASLIGREIDYILITTGSVGPIGFNTTWINVGNMSGAGVGAFVPPSGGKGKFLKR